MLQTTQFTAASLGYPDTNGPTPFANAELSTSRLPNILNHFSGAGSVHSLLTQGTISSGDEGGVPLGLGVVSKVVAGPNRTVVSSVRVFNGVSTAVKLGAVGAGAGVIPNTVEAQLIPSLNRVCIFS